MIALWKKTQGWKLPLLALIGLTFALVSVLGRAEVPPKEPVTMPPVSPYAQSVVGIGVIEPQSEIVAIGSEIPGVVREVHVKVGDKVSKGAPLFSIDQRDIDAQIAVLEAALISARVQADDADFQYKIVQNMGDKRAVAKEDFSRRKYAAQLAAARIVEAEAQLNQARTTKDRMTIKAPIDGAVLSVDIRDGEYAIAGATSMPMIRMGDLSRLHVRVEFDEENAASLSQAAAVKAYLRGDTSKVYDLSFIRFEPFVAPKQNLAVAGQRVDTRVIEAVYALPDDVQNLLIGQQMDVFVEKPVQ